MIKYHMVNVKYMRILIIFFFSKMVIIGLLILRNYYFENFQVNIFQHHPNV